MIEFQCKACGSRDVSRDATNTWEITTQKWVAHDGDLDCSQCNECGEEGIVAVPLDREVVNDELVTLRLHLGDLRALIALTEWGAEAISNYLSDQKFPERDGYTSGNVERMKLDIEHAPEILQKIQDQVKVKV